MSKWIAWHGLTSEQPVIGKAKILLRSGMEYQTENAEDFRWNHTGNYSDVVSYMIEEESQEIPQQTEDAVNNPKHYTSHPSGVECLDVTRHMSFNLGNATKYIWRCDLKKDAIEDLRKAIFYLNDEINLRLSKKEC